MKQKVKDIIVVIFMFAVVLIAAVSFLISALTATNDPQQKATAYLIVSLFLVFQLFIIWVVFISSFRS